MKHHFCRTAASIAAKDLGLKVRKLQAVNTTSCYFDVYNGKRMGSYEGCCKYSAILKYLDRLPVKKAGR